MKALRRALVLALVAAAGCGGGEDPPEPTVEAAFDEPLPGVRAGDPVRVAGVDIGKVEKVRREDGGTVLVLRRDGPAWSIPANGEVKVRPRIFAEGRYFIDIGPGEQGWGGEMLEDGDRFPPERTEPPRPLRETLLDPP